MARKNLVLDTNVLLHDPRAIYTFHDNHVIIPIYVIEEIDTFKKDQSELGRNARQVARLLERVGSFETGFVERDDNRRFWDLPNVLGVVPR